MKREQDIDKTEYGTPMYILAAACEVQGGAFDLDPFSSEWHNARVKANDIITKEDDAFTTEWIDGRNESLNVWCNPPYPAQILGRAVSRWIEAIEASWTLNSFLLVPATPATAWAQQVLEWPHCLLRQRVKHHHPTLPPEQTLNGTRHDSMIVYAGPRVPAFRRVFRELGHVR